MVRSTNTNFLIPQVNRTSVNKTDTSNLKNESVDSNEFKNLFDDEINKLNFSSHAIKRIQERQINIDQKEIDKITSATKQLKAKGGQDSLVITDNAAYIIDVAKNTVVTAIDKNNIDQNVFTKIDSTILMN